jgi:carbonic anhydrase
LRAQRANGVTATLPPSFVPTLRARIDRARLASLADSRYESLVQKLVEGVHAFRSQYFASHSALFRRLAECGQSPETLFITCADARVVPNLFTNTAPGELFIVRNVGNIVPHPTLPGGTAAAIEYAVEVLGVTDVIVCGHTDCGAVRALLEPAATQHLPFVKKWLAQAERVRTIVAERYGHLGWEERMLAAVGENVLVQLENLRDFPFVAERLDSGKLSIAGWVYKIDSGEVFSYQPSSGQFVELGTDSASSLTLGQETKASM